MKTESNIKQGRVLIEPIDSVMVRVTLNANESNMDGRYTYDSYSCEVINRPALQQIIEQDFDAWVENFAKSERTKPPTIEERLAGLEAVVKGTPSYGELLEAVNILLGE